MLIPPSFGVVSVASTTVPGDDCLPLASDLRHLQGRLLSDQLVPSLLSDVSARDLSNRILNDYMQAGFWLSTSQATPSLTSAQLSKDDDAGASSSSTTSVKAGFQISDDGAPDRRGGLGHPWSTSSNSLMSNGLVSLQHASLDSRLQTRVCVGTDPSAAPCATVAYQLLSPATSSNNQLAVMAHGSALGRGWVGAHAKLASVGTTTSKFGNLQLGSWAEGSFVAKKCTQWTKFPVAHEDPQSSSSTLPSLLGNAVDSVGAYAAADFLASTAAFQVLCRLPSTNLAHPSTPQLQTRSYFSINLADESRTQSASGQPPSPPLVVTLERCGGGSGQAGRSYSGYATGEEVVSSLSVSQVLHLDRYQINPLEDRAPKIRNTLGWTIRLERVAASSTSSSLLSHDEVYSAAATTPDGLTAATTTRLAVGGAWQINRAVAVKAVANPDAFTAALILRRWKEPRVTCSLLFRNQLSQDGFGSSSASSSSSWMPRFAGVGLQVETGDQLYQGGNYHYADQRKVPFGASSASSPETKATLPH